MAFDVNAFMGDIFQGVAIDDSVKAALANPVVAKRLEEAALRQSDYSKLASEYKEKIKGAQDYWDGLAKYKKELETSIEKERTTLRQRLVDEGIDLGDPAKVTPQPGVSKDELQKLAQESLAYMNEISRLNMKHYKEFGEILDPDELLKVSAANGGISVSLAYDQLVKPKREELQKADIAKQLAAAREEGKLEAQKNFQIPSNEGGFQSGVPSALDNLGKASAEFGQMAAVKAWQEHRRSGKPLPIL